MIGTDTAVSASLWVGTSQGSVLVIVINLAAPGEPRLTQPVMVSPSGEYYLIIILHIYIFPPNKPFLNKKNDKLLLSKPYQRSTESTELRHFLLLPSSMPFCYCREYLPSQRLHAMRGIHRADGQPHLEPERAVAGRDERVPRTALTDAHQIRPTHVAFRRRWRCWLRRPFQRRPVHGDGIREAGPRRIAAVADLPLPRQFGLVR